MTTLTSSHLLIVVTNAGPCNVPDAVVTFTFPAGASVTAAAVSPSGWTCAGVGTNSISCPPSGGSGPTMGVPGNHEFDLSFALGSAADQTITAQVTVGGGAAACTDGNSSTTCDPSPDNNTIWALVVDPSTAASLTTCASKPCTQYTDMTVPAGGTGGTVQVQQSESLCPAGFPNSFGKCVSISSAIANAPGAVTTLILTIDASLAHGAYGGVNVINSTNGSAWSIVGNCSKNNPTYPCVFQKTKFKVGATTYIQFVIHKIDDDGWGFDG